MNTCSQATGQFALRYIVSKRKINKQTNNNNKKKPWNFQHFSLVLFLFEWSLAFEHERLASALWTHFGNSWKVLQRPYWTRVFQCRGAGDGMGSLHCLVPFELQCELRFWDLMLLQWRGGTRSTAAVCLSPPQQTAHPEHVQSNQLPASS